MPKAIRTDNWRLRSTALQQRMVQETVDLYRAYVKALIGVVWVHAREIHAADSACAAVERLTHATAKNPNPKYRYFDRRFPKFPSYLRRAAIEAALGQASSFSTRYDRWQSQQRAHPLALPPQRTSDNALNPPLYRGQCVLFDQQYTRASIKVWNGTDWIWIDLPIHGKRQRHAVSTNKMLSPVLLCRRGRVLLGVPFESKVSLPSARSVERVCGVDLGINTTATASIITADGTVVARRFFHRAADIDRRDKGLGQIRRKARQTMGKTGKLGKGFCRHAYLKADRRNKEMSHHLSGQLLAFAREHGALAIVFEYLKSFRPQGGRKASGLRQRFHGWLHRQLVKKVSEMAQEGSMRVEYVSPSGTSKYAFDGSGLVRRDPRNKALATFANGKQYNADLSASYNIAARFFARVLKLGAGNGNAGSPGRSSRLSPRIPVTLSTLWLHAQSGRVEEREAATTAPAGA